MRCKIDNSQCSAKCSSIVVKLIRTIKASGTAIPTQNNAAVNGVIVPFEDNTIIAQKVFPGVPSRHKDNDFREEIGIFMTAFDDNFKEFRKNREKPPFSSEDLAFVRNGL